MSNYNEKNPVVSLRLEKKLLRLIDDFISAARIPSRQKYLKDLIIEDLKSRELLEIEYKYLKY